MVMEEQRKEFEEICYQAACDVIPHADDSTRLRLANTVVKMIYRRMQGGQLYFSPRAYEMTAAERDDKVRRMFNGRNATEIARVLGIGRATVYRILKRPG